MAVEVELTATEQVGVHRYSFDNFDARRRVILIDSSYALPPLGCKQSHVNIDPSKNEITGSIFFKGSLSKIFGGVTTYFVITFTNWTDFGTWTDGALAHGQTTTDGCSSGAYIILPANQEQITVYVSISFISIEQARTNLQMQTKLQSFDSIREFVQHNWLNEISRFEVCSVQLAITSVKAVILYIFRSVLNGIMTLKSNSILPLFILSQVRLSGTNQTVSI
jgi:putative alpha-1,2-mannosidase